ncbi:hypothetical protein PRNP1_010259 [Phytophthora ramorum]
MDRLVWFRLVGEGGNPITTADAVQPEGVMVVQFRDAVKAKLSNHLEKIDAVDLKVYADWEAYNRKQGPLQADANIAETGKSVAAELVVEVPVSKEVDDERIAWTAPEARPQLGVRADDQLIRLSEAMIEGSGVGDSGQSLMLFCRQQFETQWSEMNRCSVENEAIEWIVGPPGTGKSCTALAFAYALDSSVWDVLWISFARVRDAFMCVWLRGNEKVTCVVYLAELQLLKKILRSTPTRKSTILFLDGYAASGVHIEEARLMCKQWHDKDKRIHRLVYVCSMSSVNKKFHRALYSVISHGKSDVDMEEMKETETVGVDMKPSVPTIAQPGQTERMTTEMSYKLESWRLEDYQKAMTYDAFFESVKDMFEPIRGSDNPEKEKHKAKIVEQKYCVAGGSARLMFAVPTDTAIASLDDALNEVSNINLMSQNSAGASAVSAINRLQAGYHRGGNDYEVRFVSDYVSRRCAVLKGPVLLQKVAQLCGVNPSMDGYLFEAWVFAMIQSSGLQWSYFEYHVIRQEKWRRSDIIFFDPTKASIAVSLDNATWLAPTKWNQGGYDAVFVDKAKTIVRFVQVTRAERHGYDHNYFIELLDKLVTHDDVTRVHFKMVELYFVVPMERLRSFRAPISSEDFQRYVVKHVSLAPSIPLSTRSHASYEMFKKCKTMVKVAGVDYEMSKRARIERSKLG